MNDATIKALADAATVIALRGAREWMDSHREARLDDYAVFCDCIRANIKMRLPEALADARDAVGMGGVAEMTFAATMALAGIDAAKEACVLV